MFCKSSYGKSQLKNVKKGLAVFVANRKIRFLLIQLAMVPILIYGYYHHRRQQIERRAAEEWPSESELQTVNKYFEQELLKKRGIFPADANAVELPEGWGNSTPGHISIIEN